MSFNNICRKRKLSESMGGVTISKKIGTCVHSSSQAVLGNETNSKSTMPSGPQTSLLAMMKDRRIESHKGFQLVRGSSSAIIEAKEVLDPNGPESPDIFLRKVMSRHCRLAIMDDRTKPSDIDPKFFDIISEENMKYYPEVVVAARQNNASELRKLREAGHSLSTSNRFGESLLHIACRRGFVETVKVLLEDPSLAIRLSDDCGRTPLHDLCWNPTPQLEICQLLLEREPSLLFLKDKRQFTPFEYAREEHWKVWKNFILDNKSLLENMEGDSSLTWMFSKKY